jgi:hypothetical protein
MLTLIFNSLPSAVWETEYLLPFVPEFLLIQISINEICIKINGILVSSVLAIVVKHAVSH